MIKSPGRGGKVGFINGRYVLMSEMLDFVKPILGNPAYFDQLAKSMYRVSSKLVVFIYAKFKLGITKSFLLDDDTFILKNFDHIFRYDIALKKDGLTNLTGDSLNVWSNIYENHTMPGTKGTFINSGSILYTWNDNDGLIDHVAKFFNCQEIFALLAQKVYNGGIRGNMWIFEQYCYAIFFYNLSKTRQIDFLVNNEVEMQTQYSKSTPGPYRNPPAIIHVVLRNKELNNEFIRKRIHLTLGNANE